MDLPRIVQAALAAGRVEHRRARFILIDRCYPGQTYHVLLVFLDGGQAPSAIIKIASDPGVAAALRREAANLQRLGDMADTALVEAVPRLVHLGSVGERVVQVQSALPGAPMTRQPKGYFDGPGFAADADRVLAWLARLGRIAPEDLPVAPEAEPGGPVEAVALFRRHHRRSRRLDALLDEAGEQLAAARWPLSARHGDFCAANLLVDGAGRIGVIDWEAPLEGTWPLFDLVTFMASLSSPASDPRTWLASHRRLAFAANPRRGGLQAALVEAVRAAGVEPAAAVALSALAWVVLANRKQVELATLQAASGIRMPDHVHLPLVALEDGRCLNLEILADRRADYLLTRG